MRKPTLKRLALGLVQQTAALLLMVAIAAILFNIFRLFSTCMVVSSKTVPVNYNVPTFSLFYIYFIF